MIEALIYQTSYFLGGFSGNLLITAVAMVVGTMLGLGLGWWRSFDGAAFGFVPRALTSVCRNIPSFVLLFYMASMVPTEIQWGGGTVFVPLWIKASLALIFPVVGFAADQSRTLFRGWTEQGRGALGPFLSAWMTYLLIILMASATASVIGADELIGRANTFVASADLAIDRGTLLLVTYGYVCLWFLACGLVLTALGQKLTKIISRT